MKTLVGAADYNDDDVDAMISAYRNDYRKNFAKLSGSVNLLGRAQNAMMGAHVRLLMAMNSIMA